MKRAIIGGVAALAILASSQAFAQTATVTIAPEQRTKIKDDVELVAVPSDWGPEVRSYRYVYSDNHVVLVEPSSRKVIQIID
jgi:hypothetical protein